MKNYILLLILSISLLIAFTSCNKENIIPNEFVDLSQDVSTQNDLLEVNESEVDDQVAAGFLDLITREFPIRSWSGPKGTYPNTLTVDYGTKGVTGRYGHVRKGKLIITLTAPITAMNAIRTVSHENFYIDDVKIEGLVSLTNKGLNALNQPVFDRIVTNRILTFPDGRTLSWNAAQTIIQTEGAETQLILLDNVFSISGNSIGINRKGETFTVLTSDPLIIKSACAWIVKGIINLSLNSKQISINYGDGACNNAASITLPDGTVKEINIRRWW